jgi:hypothetical protein
MNPCYSRSKLVRPLPSNHAVPLKTTSASVPDSILPIFPTTAPSTKRRSSRTARNFESSPPKVDLVDGNKKMERRPRSKNPLDDEPYPPLDIVIGVKTTPPVVNDDGSETVHEAQDYTLADYIYEVQEAYAGLNTNILSSQAKCEALKVDNLRLVAERDGSAAHVNTLLTNSAHAKKEALENLAIIPKLVEKTQAQQEEIARYIKHF